MDWPPREVMAPKIVKGAKVVFGPNPNAVSHKPAEGLSKMTPAEKREWDLNYRGITGSDGEPWACPTYKAVPLVGEYTVTKARCVVNGMPGMVEVMDATGAKVYGERKNVLAVG